MCRRRRAAAWAGPAENCADSDIESAAVAGTGLAGSTDLGPGPGVRSDDAT